MQTARLKVRFHDGREEQHTLALGSYLVGREQGDIVLGDPKASGKHARIDVLPGRVMLIDEASTNGTFDGAGNRILEPWAMQPGQAARLGDSTLTLLSLHAPKGTQLAMESPVAADAKRTLVAASSGSLAGRASPEPPCASAKAPVPAAGPAATPDPAAAEAPPAPGGVAAPSPSAGGAAADARVDTPPPATDVWANDSLPDTAPGAGRLSWWRVLFGFRGRVRRLTYWLYSFTSMFVVSTVAMVAAFQVASPVNLEDPQDMQRFVVPFMLFFYPPVLWMGLALQVKRWHDRDKSGWWIFLNLVPLVNLWALIETGFLPGTRGPNTYGPDPKA